MKKLRVGDYKIKAIFPVEERPVEESAPANLKLDRAAHHKRHGGKGSHKNCKICDEAERLVRDGHKIAQYTRHPIFRLDNHTAGLIHSDDLKEK